MIARDLAHLHGDTIELARLGNNLTKRTGLTEKGQIVPGLNDYQVPRDSDWEYTKTTPYTNRHEMLTGSQLDGRAYPPGIDYTCNNWTSNRDPAPGQAQGGRKRPEQAECANRISRSQRWRQRLVEFIARHDRLQSDGAEQDAWRRHVLLLRDQLRRPMKNTCLLDVVRRACRVEHRDRARPRECRLPDRIPSSLMTFFVTSEPIGDGGNLGGLAGADAHCQKLATAVGAGGKTWRAYLSTQARPGQPAVNARDRIGKGPWFKREGAGSGLSEYAGSAADHPVGNTRRHPG